MASADPNPSITLRPALPEDAPHLANLEVAAFSLDPFTSIAFGPGFDSADAVNARTEALAKIISHKASAAVQPRPGTGREDVMVAVALSESGQEEIVGYALWEGIVAAAAAAGAGPSGEPPSRDWEIPTGVIETLHLPRSGEDFSTLPDEERQAKARDALFGTLGRWKREQVGERRVASLQMLIVSPAHQNMGIGSTLLSHGLARIDALGLDTWIGSSEPAHPLYLRNGFVDLSSLELDLAGYGGKEGSKKRHWCMLRQTAFSIVV